MPFYDNFASNEPIGLGMKIAMAETRAMWKYILKYLPPQAVSYPVLEVGPGRGTVAQVLKESSPYLRYVGVDANYRLLKNLPQGVDAVTSWVPPLPFRNESFSVCFASHVLEHMPTYLQAINFLAEMRRAVAVEGLVCLRTPDFRASERHFWNVDYSHAFPTTPRRLVQMYMDVGLEVVRVFAASGPWIGKIAYLAGFAANFVPTWFINDGVDIQDGFVKRWYSLKMTFLRSIFIIGKKVK